MRGREKVEVEGETSRSKIQEYDLRIWMQDDQTDIRTRDRSRGREEMSRGQSDDASMKSHSTNEIVNVVVPTTYQDDCDLLDKIVGNAWLEMQNSLFENKQACLSEA